MAKAKTKAIDKYNLFLDDVRLPNSCVNYCEKIGIDPVIFISNRWLICRDYHAFVNMINDKGLPNIVAFDHDLADISYDPKTGKESFTYQEKTGMDCAKWLVEYCIERKLKLPTYYVHSANPVGRENIKSYLDNYVKSL